MTRKLHVNSSGLGGISGNKTVNFGNEHRICIAIVCVSVCLSVSVSVSVCFGVSVSVSVCLSVSVSVSVCCRVSVSVNVCLSVSVSVSVVLVLVCLSVFDILHAEFCVRKVFLFAVQMSVSYRVFL